jgi:hypothetical protein
MQMAYSEELKKSKVPERGLKIFASSPWWTSSELLIGLVLKVIYSLAVF